MQHLWRGVVTFFAALGAIVGVFGAVVATAMIPEHVVNSLFAFNERQSDLAHFVYLGTTALVIAAVAAVLAFIVSWAVGRAK